MYNNCPGCTPSNNESPHRSIMQILTFQKAALQKLCAISFSHSQNGCTQVKAMFCSGTSVQQGTHKCSLGYHCQALQVIFKGTWSGRGLPLYIVIVHFNQGQAPLYVPSQSSCVLRDQSMSKRKECQQFWKACRLVGKQQAKEWERTSNLAQPRFKC